MSMTTVQLDERETRIRINQGKSLAQVHREERTALAEQYRITSSSQVFDQVQIATMFASEKSPFNMDIVTKTKWTALIALSRVKRTDPELRIMLAHIVLDYVEAHWKGEASLFGIKDDPKIITPILARPDLYRDDVKVLFAKLKAARGWELSEEEEKLVRLPTPDLPNKIKENAERIIPAPTGKIEQELQEIKSTIESIDSSVVDLEFNSAKSLPALPPELAAKAVDFIENIEKFVLPADFTKKVLDFIDSFEIAESGLMTSDGIIIATQQRQIQALTSELEDMRCALAESQEERRQLSERNAIIEAKLTTVQEALSLISEALPEPVIVEATSTQSEENGQV